MVSKEIERFSVSYLQVLDEEGRVDPDLEPALSEAELHRLYRAMVVSRRADERMLKMQRQGRLGTFGPCVGQEAASCGPALAMEERDWLVTGFREMGARLLRGDRLLEVLLMWKGYEEGCVLPEKTRTLPVSIIVGSQTLHAAGLAYAMQYKGEKDAAVLVFFGDGASSQGEVHEAMNFAGLWKAPVVFICQNNQWAISVPRSKQTAAATIAQKALAHGFPGIQVDGNDALAAYKATKEALDRARAGEGPTLIEAVTYRLMMHTTADDPTRYRSKEEEEAWWKREPLIRFRKYLEGKGLWDGERQAALEAEADREIEEAVQALEGGMEVKPDACFDHVFGTPHYEIERQREAFLREVAREQEEEAHRG